MANRVRISLIGTGRNAWEHDFGQSAVDGVIRYWRGALEGVLHDRPDLIVLPECCDRCWTANVTREQFIHFYETRGDQLLDALADIAARHRCYITCPTWRKADDGTWRNSIQLLDRKGQVAGVYDKNFPIVPEMEVGVEPGSEANLIECDFGRVACAICFDLNFEELRAHYARLKPDLVLFSSVYHGGLMQAYWAYSIRAHFAGAIAKLPSQIYNPLGMQLASTTNYTLTLTHEVNLDCRVAHLDNNWLKFADIKKQHGPDVTILEPGLLAPVVITSHSDAFTADELVREHGIELLDAYLDRSREHRSKRLAARLGADSAAAAAG